TYDAEQLNPIRQQKSGVAARNGLWEVRRDPYDVSRVFVRGPDGWITCQWKYLEKVPAPFGELAWDHVSGRLAEQGRGNASELERAQGADDESRHRQLTVLAGWRRFVDEEPAPPELLPDQEWRRLGDAGLLAYDEARLNHHSRLLVVATPVIRKVITEGRRLSYLNRNA